MVPGPRHERGGVRRLPLQQYPRMPCDALSFVWRAHKGRLRWCRWKVKKQELTEEAEQERLASLERWDASTAEAAKPSL